MKSTVVGESLSSLKPMYCSREYQASTRLIQQYEKSTLNYYLTFITLFYFIFIMFVIIILCLHRCYNANYVYSLVSSLISLPYLCTDVVVLGIITLVCTDVMVQHYYLFIFSSGMDCNIPSLRCGRLYFPMFLYILIIIIIIFI